MYPSGLALTIGTEFSSTPTTPSVSDFVGKIHSFAIWKNRVIGPAEVSALYNAYVNGTGGEARSGFISRSPRLMLRELDDLPGSYPTVSRTGDPTRTGTLTSNFDDTTSIVFSGSENPVFPSMLPKRSGFRSQAVDIVGQDSDISASLPIRSYQHPNHLHYSPTEDVGAFDENRTIPAADFFLSGTDPDVIPGFTSPVRSKIAIDIDITPQEDVKLGRNVERRNDAESQPISPDNTGFYYFNFREKKWEQIGKTDPAFGSEIYFDFSIDTTSASTVSASFPSQFSFSNNTAMAESSSYGDIRRELGYPKIGTPIITLEAPAATKYHATSSQTLRMSDYISSPFLLEAIQVEFSDVNAQRVNGGTPPGSPGSSDDLKLKSGSIRDIDNYVFFAYRQSRNNRMIDSVSDVSSSQRFIIFSGSMSFWNSASLSGSSLLHSPAFDYEFGLPVNTSYLVGTFTGSINMKLKPAVAGLQIVGQSRVPRSTGIGTRYAYGAWPGGTSSKLPNLSLASYGLSPYVSYTDTSKLISDQIVIDPRSIRKFGGEIDSAVADAGSTFPAESSTSTPQSNDSPYLLFPEDEIILGLEAGIGAVPGQGNVSNITGSFMRINSSPCKITLYGSLIKDGFEKFSSLNQNLCSNSIHEIIGAEAVVDQFQIEPVSSYYGSYLDEIVTGSMASPIFDGILFITASQDQSRRVISRASSGQASTTGSFQRFSTLINTEKIVLDSCLPDYQTMINLTPEASEYTLLGENVPRFFTSIGLYETNFTSSKLKQFPFEGDPPRRLKQNSAILAKQVGSSEIDFASDPINLTGKDLDPLSVIYRVGYSFISNARGDKNFTTPFFTLGTKEFFDLSQNIVSSYSIDMDAYGLNLVRDQVDGGYGNSLDIIAGATYLDVELIEEGPEPNIEDLSLDFQSATVSEDVQYLVASDDWDDHKMSSGGVDLPFTLSIVFRSSTNSADALIQRAFYQDPGADLIEYEMSIDSSRNANFRIFYNNTTNYKGVESTSTVPDGEWVHLVATYDGSGSTGVGHMRLYLNGNEMNVTEFSNSPGSAMTVSSNARLTIGAKLQGDMEPNPAGELDGDFNSCQIWKNRELTADEVRGLHLALFTGTSQGLIKHRTGSSLKSMREVVLQPGAYRYGISNVNQEFWKSCFRSDRHGQFRDMIEQSKDTAVIGKSPPVKIKFLSGSTNVDPMLTYSQNLDVFATSSLPYFDGVARNRPDNPDESLVEVIA
jgi:hypothetical protein